MPRHCDGCRQFTHFCEAEIRPCTHCVCELCAKRLYATTRPVCPVCRCPIVNMALDRYPVSPTVLYVDRRKNEAAVS